MIPTASKPMALRLLQVLLLFLVIPVHGAPQAALRTVEDIETADRGWNLSEPVDFTVISGETTDLDVPIVCYDDGVEDRCSGL